ncbi:hypothetical protein RJ639_024285 [Escallonia herrerae]|uniref:SHSP domain-containing protein n=1 Tax=Escallonia herrerae TaxID=1293975 RepID=A0AA88V1G8_9ASTE|nr:hypothetical protein RJ639_024285 [Escallonia herrerae]
MACQTPISIAAIPGRNEGVHVGENVYQYAGSRKGFEANAVPEGLYVRIDMPGVENEEDFKVWMEGKELFFKGKAKKQSEHELSNRVYGGRFDLSSDSGEVTEVKTFLQNGVLRMKNTVGTILTKLEAIGTYEVKIIDQDNLFMRVDMPDVPNEAVSLKFCKDMVIFGGGGLKASEHDQENRKYFGRFHLRTCCCFAARCSANSDYNLSYVKSYFVSNVLETAMVVKDTESYLEGGQLKLTLQARGICDRFLLKDDIAKEAHSEKSDPRDSLLLALGDVLKPKTYKAKCALSFRMSDECGLSADAEYQVGELPELNRDASTEIVSGKIKYTERGEVCKSSCGGECVSVRGIEDRLRGECGSRGFDVRIDMPGVENEEDFKVWMEGKELFFKGKAKKQSEHEPRNRVYGGRFDLSSDSGEVTEVKTFLQNRVLRMVLFGCAIQPDSITPINKRIPSPPTDNSDHYQSEVLISGDYLMINRTFTLIDPPEKYCGYYPYQLGGTIGTYEVKIIDEDNLFMRVDMPDVPNEAVSLKFCKDMVIFGGGGGGLKASEHDQENRKYFGRFHLRCFCCKIVGVEHEMKAGVPRIMASKRNFK